MANDVRACDVRDVATKIRPFVQRRVHADEVDDVLQEILIRVHDGFAGIDDNEQFARWLHRVAGNVIIDHHRRRQRRERKHSEFAMERIPPESERDSETDLSEFVAAFVEMLPSPYREALVLTEINGLTMKQAAEREGISESGMKSRVQRGRRMLRELFEGCCEIALDVRGHVLRYSPKW